MAILGPSDINSDLNNPDSFLFKVREVQKFDALMEEEYLVEYREFYRQLQRIQLAEDKSEAERAVYQQEKLEKFLQQQQQNYADGYVAAPTPQVEVKINLAQQLADLLKLKQEDMSLPQLKTHHQNLMNNFNNQILAKIGPVMTLTDGTKVTMPKAFTPLSSLERIFEVNPELAKYVNSDPKIRTGFETFHANNQLNVTGVFSKLNDVLNVENQASLSKQKEREILHRFANETKAVLAVRSIITEALLKNNRLVLINMGMRDRINILSLPNSNGPSLSQPPAMFGMSPYQQAMTLTPFHHRKLRLDDKDDAQPAPKRLKTS